MEKIEPSIARFCVVIARKESTTNHTNLFEIHINLVCMFIELLCETVSSRSFLCTTKKSPELVPNGSE